MQLQVDDNASHARDARLLLCDARNLRLNKRVGLLRKDRLLTVHRCHNWTPCKTVRQVHIHIAFN